MKRSLSLLLALLLCLCTFTAPACAATVSARTPLHSASDAQLANIELAMQQIDGLIIPCGESFSFNETIGPRTSAYGYQPAMNARGVRVTGGGVAQVATTLYLALLEIGGGVRFDSLKTYGPHFRGGYVEDGEFAVITDYSADMDFAFTNLSDDLTLQMWATSAYLYCTIAQSGGSQAVVKSSYLDWNAMPKSSSYQRLAASSQIEIAGSEALINTITLAAGSITDPTLPAGAIFSFNETVGPRTEKHGYRPALNGRGVKVVGGGVAQVASAIWLAVKQSDDVSIVAKSTYGEMYNQSYVLSSNDAILTDFNAGTDFAFRNSSGGTLTIETYVLENILYCNIYLN